MDHLFMIVVTGICIALYVYKCWQKGLSSAVYLICVFGIAWLSVYGLVELGRSTTVWFSGKAGDSNPLTAILLGGAIAINMPSRPSAKKDVDAKVEGV